LIFGKTVTIVASRCHILRLKCTKLYISAEVLPQTPVRMREERGEKGK